MKFSNSHKFPSVGCKEQMHGWIWQLYLLLKVVVNLLAYNSAAIYRNAGGRIREQF